MQSTKWELYEYQRSRSVIDLGPNHLHSLFLNFFSSITADFNTSSAIRWAIQDQWSSGFLISWKRNGGYSSISADTLISIRCTYIRKSKGYGPVLLELLAFVKFLNAVKSLCAHYLFNQWPEFDQTNTDKSLGRGKDVFRYWWDWPYFEGHYIIKTLKVSLVCTLSHESINGIWHRITSFPHPIDVAVLVCAS